MKIFHKFSLLLFVSYYFFSIKFISFEFSSASDVFLLEIAFALILSIKSIENQLPFKAFGAFWNLSDNFELGISIKQVLLSPSFW